MIDKIMDKGLCRMNRNHIHMAVGLPTGASEVISGMRESCEVVIEIGANQAHYAGKIPFYLSANRVVLSPGLGREGTISREYFRSIY